MGQPPVRHRTASSRSQSRENRQLAGQWPGRQYVIIAPGHMQIFDLSMPVPSHMYVFDLSMHSTVPNVDGTTSPSSPSSSPPPSPPSISAFARRATASPISLCTRQAAMQKG
eukprot:352703-Chlamydomonas_euryale.AAC.2